MGIYIKGMKMPEDYESIRIEKRSDGKVYAVEEVGSFSEILFEIVEVAEPHGRMIDESKIPDRTLRVLLETAKAPTVIEAEGME